MVKVLVAAGLETFSELAAAMPAQDNAVTFEFESAADEVLHRLETGVGDDILLLDFELAGLNGLKGIHTVLPALGGRPLGTVMPGASLELAKRALAAGAQGVLPALVQGEALKAAVVLLRCGQRFAIVDHDAPFDRLEAAETLSERELQVLRGICEGHQNKEIAHSFQVQEVTVKMHVRAIIRKLGASNRTHAAMIARDLGIV